MRRLVVSPKMNRMLTDHVLEMTVADRRAVFAAACAGFRTWQRDLKRHAVKGERGVPARLWALIGRGLPAPLAERMDRVRARLQVGGDFVLLTPIQWEGEGSIRRPTHDVMIYRRVELDLPPGDVEDFLYFHWPLRLPPGVG